MSPCSICSSLLVAVTMSWMLGARASRKSKCLVQTASVYTCVPCIALLSPSRFSIERADLKSAALFRSSASNPKFKIPRAILTPRLRDADQVRCQATSERREDILKNQVRREIWPSFDGEAASSEPENRRVQRLERFVRL